MFSRKPKVATSVNHFTSLIAADMVANGPISFGGSLKVCGTVLGDIIGSSDKPSTIVVEKTGAVLGNINAGTVIISGKLEGSIRANSVCITSTANISGDFTIEYGLIQIDSGADVSDINLKKVHIGPTDAPLFKEQKELDQTKHIKGVHQ